MATMKTNTPANVLDIILVRFVKSHTKFVGKQRDVSTGESAFMTAMISSINANVEMVTVETIAKRLSRHP